MLAFAATSSIIIPISIAFISKLNSLCRLTNSREIAALIAIDRIENGEKVEYEVIPI